MIVNDPDLVGDIIAWCMARRAAKQPVKRTAPKRKAPRKVQPVKTAADHRKVYGVSPALRVINGGKA